MQALDVKGRVQWMVGKYHWADVKLLHQMEHLLILWFYLVLPSGEGLIGSLVRR